jgi:zinc/manganese transport system substrate-binding protein
MLSFLTAVAMLLALGPVRAAASIAVVAAENFYGGVAQQIGTPHVAVTSILSNPDQDPHLFEVSPSTARALYAARIVVYNGIDYDPWMARLSGATANHDRQIIVAADLVGRKIGHMNGIGRAQRLRQRTGDRRHRFGIVPDMWVVTGAAPRAISPLARADRRQNCRASRASGRHAVTATEPVFGYM